MLSFRASEILPAFFLVLALLLGGASAAGALSNALLQLLAIAILGWMFWTSRKQEISLTRSEGTLLLLWLATAVWLLITLIPLPPAIWTLLPGRGFVEGGYKLAGMDLPWLPITLSPARTIWSGLALLPMLAMMFLVFRTSQKGLYRMAMAFMVVTVVAALIGISQVLSGSGSPLYFYEFTNFGMATGFFSNANHMASSIVICLPFLALIPMRNSKKRRETDQKVAQYVGVVSISVVLGGALLLTQSVAAWLLALPAMVAAWLLWRGRKITPRGIGLLALFGLLSVVGLVGALAFAPDMLEAVGRYTSTGAAESNVRLSRSDFYATSWRAIPQFLPLGSGLGSFAQVYPLFEDPDFVVSTYANHAHSDYIEIAMELGIPGLLLVLVGLYWWARKMLVIWLDAVPSTTLARAATVSAGLLIAHSLVDYPLRTAALAVTFAALMAIIARPERD